MSGANCIAAPAWTRPTERGRIIWASTTSRQSRRRATTCGAFSAQLDGQRLEFDTDAGVFSRGELDAGTELLIRALPELRGRVLDLGCGWGALGLFVKARNPGIVLTAVDINARAVELTRGNAALNALECEALESDGFGALAGRMFDAIITNPPIRTGSV